MKTAKSKKPSRHEIKAPRYVQVRDARFDLLDRWLAWAFDEHGDLGKLGPEFTGLARDTMHLAWRLDWPRVDQDAVGAMAEFQAVQVARLLDLRWVQSNARQAFEFIAGPAGATWTLPTPANGAPALLATRYESGIGLESESGIQAVGAKAIEALMLFNSEITRVQGCAEVGCKRIFVRRKAGRYCHEHGTDRTRRRRFLARLTPADKKARRRTYYLNWAKKHEPARYRHLVKAEKARLVSPPKQANV